jgi:hypothetical protein
LVGHFVEPVPEPVAAVLVVLVVLAVVAAVVVIELHRTRRNIFLSKGFFLRFCSGLSNKTKKEKEKKAASWRLINVKSYQTPLGPFRVGWHILREHRPS